MDTSHNYVVAVTSGVARFHRPTCKRLAKLDPKIVGRIGDRTVEDAWPNAEPATCCKPNPDELRRQRNEASSAQADAEQSAADARIAEVAAAVKAGEPIPAKPAVEAPAAPAAEKAKRPRYTSARYLAAIALKKAANNKRGAGRAISEPDLVAYVVSVRTANPGTTFAEEMEIAYWTENLAVSRSRFAKAWEAASAAPLPVAS